MSPIARAGKPAAEENPRSLRREDAGPVLLCFHCHWPACPDRHGYVIRKGDEPNPCTRCGQQSMIVYDCRRAWERGPNGKGGREIVVRKGYQPPKGPVARA